MNAIPGEYFLTTQGYCIAQSLSYEHDASRDQGEAYQEFFGKTYYTFGHNGAHFIALDNVSDPRALIGEEQLQWRAAGPWSQPQEANPSQENRT